MGAEQRKLSSKSANLDRDRSLAPWLAVTALVGGVIGAIGGIITVPGVVARGKGWGRVSRR